MLNRIVLCTVKPGPTSDEKEILAALGFDLSTYQEEKGECSILLPAHLDQKEGARINRNYHYKEEILFEKFCVLTRNISQNTWQDKTVYFEIHKTANEVIKRLKALKTDLKTFTTVSALNGLQSASIANNNAASKYRASPTTQLSTSESSLALYQSEPSTPFPCSDRAGNETPLPFTVSIDAIDILDEENKKLKKKESSMSSGPI